MKPRHAAPQLLKVMDEWLKENVEPRDREQTLQHVKCTLFVQLKYQPINEINSDKEP